MIEIKFKKSSVNRSSRILKRFKNELNQFFEKKIKKLNYPFTIHGEFLKVKILNELNKIPYGQTRSYGQIAKKVNSSPRYVGRVCSENKHLILIPCHRVIRSDGSLGGFSAKGGIKLKEKLINMESL